MSSHAPLSSYHSSVKDYKHVSHLPGIIGEVLSHWGNGGDALAPFNRERESVINGHVILTVGMYSIFCVRRNGYSAENLS